MSAIKKDENVKQNSELINYCIFLWTTTEQKHKKDEKVSPKTDKKVQKALKVPKMENSRNLTPVGLARL